MVSKSSSYHTPIIVECFFLGLFVVVVVVVVVVVAAPISGSDPKINTSAVITRSVH